MASNIYPQGLLHMFKVGTNNVDFRLLLLDTGTSYTFNGTHQYVSSVTASETTVTDGYTRLAVAETVQLDTGNSRIELVLPSTTWTGLGGVSDKTINGAIVYDHNGGSDAARPLLAYWALTPSLTNNQNFTLTFDQTEGNIRIPYVIA